MIRTYSDTHATDTDMKLTRAEKNAQLKPQSKLTSSASGYIAHLVSYAKMEVKIAPEIKATRLAIEIALMTIFAPTVSWARTWVLSLKSQKI